MVKTLREIAEIYLGQSIRDKIENVPTGSHFIVQMKDVSISTGVMANGLYKINLKGRIGPRLVKNGDILFVSRVFRGSLPYSVLVKTDLPNLVAAPTFTILSVDKEIVRAEYLNWLINSEAHGGKYFKKNAMGSSILNITKSVLSDMKVPIPSLETQDRIIKFIKTAEREKEIMESLVEKRRAFMDEILAKYIE